MKKSGKKLLQELEELAGRAGVKIRYESTDARGGMCVYRGVPMIIVDRRAAEDYKISVVADNLKKLDLSGHYVSPRLRDLLDGV